MTWDPFIAFIDREHSNHWDGAGIYIGLKWMHAFCKHMIHLSPLLRYPLFRPTQFDRYHSMETVMNWDDYLNSEMNRNRKNLIIRFRGWFTFAILYNMNYRSHIDKRRWIGETPFVLWSSPIDDWQITSRVRSGTWSHRNSFSTDSYFTFSNRTSR